MRLEVIKRSDDAVDWKTNMRRADCPTQLTCVPWQMPKNKAGEI